MPKINLFNDDCMNLMKQMKDNEFDLAIVDPPYGIGADWLKRNKGHKFATTSYSNSSIPSPEYFEELFRVSRNQIIFGYNYFTHILGPSNYLIIWDKESNNNQTFKYSKCEIAYTSYHIPCNIFHYPWDGYRMGSETGHRKIHPHQKPVALYEWLLITYAKDNVETILDTHLGSGSSAIAAYNLGYDFTGIEVDKAYFEAAKKRIKESTRQLNLQFEYAEDGNR